MQGCAETKICIIASAWNFTPCSTAGEIEKLFQAFNNVSHLKVQLCKLHNTCNILLWSEIAKYGEQHCKIVVRNL